jgi:hypothetical protein
MKIAVCIAFAAAIQLSPVLAEVEQCRFIEAKPDREACYQRQEAALAAKRKAKEVRDAPLKPLEQRDPEDIQLSRTLHSICRGC